MNLKATPSTTPARNGYPTRDVLERDLLLATEFAGEVVPTVAGLLLFGRDERVAELLPRAAVSATRFAGDSIQSPIVERVSIAGNLLTLYEATLRFVSPLLRICGTRARRVFRRLKLPTAPSRPARIIIAARSAKRFPICWSIATSRCAINRRG